MHQIFLGCFVQGLDPASRRGLWEVVKNSKDGRALILTTHSMEEAEMLCDRLGIFVDGQLVCIGNPKEITGRYAGYLVFSITVPYDQEPKARQLIETMSPTATLTYALGGTLKVGVGYYSIMQMKFLFPFLLHPYRNSSLPTPHSTNCRPARSL